MHSWYYYSNNLVWPFLRIGLFAFIIHVLFWILVISLIIKVVKKLFGHDECCMTAKSHVMNEGNESNLEIIKKRYAKGEITKKEFDQLKKDLS